MPSSFEKSCPYKPAFVCAGRIDVQDWSAHDVRDGHVGATDQIRQPIGSDPLIVVYERHVLMLIEFRKASVPCGRNSRPWFWNIADEVRLGSTDRLRRTFRIVVDHHDVRPIDYSLVPD
jgi:hypothetical protein